MNIVNVQNSPRPITIKDVARMAGVSHATVSRVLNGSDLVSPTTRARVRAAIDASGWTPDETAAALGRRKTLGPARPS
jgi:DNA-binding LacI/PurR family transcriptional regulator